jgi:hypothetical protein
MEVIPASKALEQFEMTWEWYFPPETRARIETRADLFETMPLEEWEQRWWERKEV